MSKELQDKHELEHEHDECCCGHDHDHEEHEHHHDHDEHDDDCCCGHDHDHEEHEHHHDHDEHDDDCCCGHDHDHEEHEHHHDHDEHDDDCCCGHDHDHEEHEHHHDHHEHDDDCCCGHDHHNHNHGHENHEVHEQDFAAIASDHQITYIVENLDCANCAAKMERKIQAMPEIQAASLIFATKQLRIAADDPAALKDTLEKVCQSVEGGVTLTVKSQTRAPKSNTKQTMFQQNKADILSIIVGAVFFAGGMIASHLGAPTGATLVIFLMGYLLLGWEVLLTSAKNIGKGQIFDENFLMSLATIAAFCIGEFTEGMGVMLFYRIGELFEHIAVEKSRTQIMEAVDMRPETVNLVTDGNTHIVPAEEAKPGDILLVRPGDRIPLDGYVTEGETRIDTSPVTGEPVPVSAAPGTKVISGCVNQEGLIKMEVEKPLSESMVSRILDSVENAAAGKPKIDKFITKFARIYTPIVVALAVLTAIIPSVITGNWEEWITTAITFLVISCPCALVISVPLAYFAGIGAGSKLGILFKGGASIEALKAIKAVVMDKTGTITKGNFIVQQIVTASGQSEEVILSLAAACEANSTHPIAKSIMDEVARRNIEVPSTEKLEEISGHGVKAVVDGKTILCGNKKLLTDTGLDIIQSSISDIADKATGTLVYITSESELLGIIEIADTIKDNAYEAISAIKINDMVPAMLTGDNEASANAVANAIGITKVFAHLLPDDKLRILQELREEFGAVMFVGDGINDAPVLAGANVGAAMGSGADAAIEAADVVFLNSSLDSIAKSVKIAKTTGTIAYQNVIFALAVKLLVLILGFLGFANIWAAVFADTGVAMLCILNSLRILLKKF